MSAIGALRYEPETPDVRELRREAIKTDLATGHIQIMGEWLVAAADECTCGGGIPETNYAHERGCGYEPLENLVELLLGPEAECQACYQPVSNHKAGCPAATA